jgi:hypothetical protein
VEKEHSALRKAMALNRGSEPLDNCGKQHAFPFSIFQFLSHYNCWKYCLQYRSFVTPPVMNQHQNIKITAVFILYDITAAAPWQTDDCAVQ